MVTVGEQREDEEKYAELSLRLLQQAQEEFDKGDRLQASEKAWGAAAHAMKAAADRRGWNHGKHRHLFAVAGQVADDAENPEIRRLFSMASSLHQNFYEDWQTDTSVQEGIEEVKRLVELMEELRAQPVRPSVVTDEQQWRTLTEPARQRAT
ncbi:MAG: hypothetical protein OXS47_00365 [Chloroflexota bacterium]|nr:hypothetical protein [Chloroflexota bacterium]